MPTLPVIHGPDAMKARPFRINFSVSIDCLDIQPADGSAETEQQMRDSVRRELTADIERTRLTYADMRVEVLDAQFEELGGGTSFGEVRDQIEDLLRDERSGDGTIEVNIGDLVAWSNALDIAAAERRSP